jgi:hypothetical protein
MPHLAFRKYRIGCYWTPLCYHFATHLRNDGGSCTSGKPMSWHLLCLSILKYGTWISLIWPLAPTAAANWHFPLTWNYSDKNNPFLCLYLVFIFGRKLTHRSVLAQQNKGQAHTWSIFRQHPSWHWWLCKVTMSFSSKVGELIGSHLF